jgi:hypothetical protein
MKEQFKDSYTNLNSAFHSVTTFVADSKKVFL